MRWPYLILIACSLVLAGCKNTAQQYVNDHAANKSIVRGKLLKFEGLTCAKVIDLSDGFALEVDKPGCTADVQQTEGKGGRQFKLQDGDWIVHAHDTDYLLTSLPPKQD